MAVTVTITSVVHTVENDRWLVNFSDGTQSEYPNREALQTAGMELDTDSEGQQVAKKMLVRWWMARDPDASEPAVVEGKSLTFDLWAPNPVVVL